MNKHDLHEVHHNIHVFVRKNKPSKLHELVIIFTAVSKDISAFAPLTAVSKRPDIGGLAPDALMAGEMPKVDDGGDGTNLGDDDHASWCVEHMGVEPKIG